MRIELEVSYQHSRKHLPVATIQRGVSGILAEPLTEQCAVSLCRFSRRPLLGSIRLAEPVLPVRRFVESA